MPSYYFFKNASHLYAVEKPLAVAQTKNDYMNENLGQWYIHTMKIKPILVNCTVAPLAEGCPLTNTRVIPSFSSYLYNISMIINHFFTHFIEEHPLMLIIIILSIFLCALLLIFSIQTFLRILRRKQNSTVSLFNRKVLSSSIYGMIEKTTSSTTHHTDNDLSYYEQISVITNPRNSESHSIENTNKKSICPYEYDYLPPTNHQCSSITCSKCVPKTSN